MILLRLKQAMAFVFVTGSLASVSAFSPVAISAGSFTLLSLEPASRRSRPTATSACSSRSTPEAIYGSESHQPSPKKTSSALSWMNKHSRSLAVAATAISATSAMLVSPSPASAVDGAIVAFADQTNSWISNVAETGFYQAFSLVFLSEIGDKTFFIAGLLAMKTSRFISFLGSMAALAVMTVLSVLIGQIFHAVPAGFGEGIPLDDIAAALAFAFFGIKTLVEAIQMDENSSIMDEELAEAQETVESSRTVKEITWVGQVISIFTLVFAAEFGDRSFLSTIALSAAQNPISVAGGAIAAHGVATGIAVSGGSFVAKYISEKVVGIIGGSLFIVFAITTALGIF